MNITITPEFLSWARFSSPERVQVLLAILLNTEDGMQCQVTMEWLQSVTGLSFVTLSRIVNELGGLSGGISLPRGVSLGAERARSRTRSAAHVTNCTPSARRADLTPETFRSAVMAYAGKYPVQMLEDFISYWGEVSDGGQKMRWQKVRDARGGTWSLAGRLSTWNRRQQQHVTGNSSASAHLHIGAEDYSQGL